MCSSDLGVEIRADWEDIKKLRARAAVHHQKANIERMHSIGLEHKACILEEGLKAKQAEMIKLATAIPGYYTVQNLDALTQGMTPEDQQSLTIYLGGKVMEAKKKTAEEEPIDVDVDMLTPEVVVVEDDQEETCN